MTLSNLLSFLNKLKAMKLKFDTYTIYARFFPGILSAMPLFVLWYFLLQEPKWNDLLTFIISLKFLGTISLSVVFLYFYSQFIRITSKYFENKYFVNATGFPTTYLMLFENQMFSDDYKVRFREKVMKTWKLEALDKEGERSQPVEAKKRLNEAFNHIRLKVGNGILVAKHNIWYGFYRNLIGGTIYSSIFCIVNILIGRLLFESTTLVSLSIFLLLAYCFIFVFRKEILVQNGEAYARQLISEFMSM